MAEVIPSVNLYKGRIVRGRERKVISKKPVEYVRTLHQKFGTVLIFDLEGIMRNRPQWSILKRWEGKETWVDAGVRFSEALFELFLSGASKVVFCTTTLRSFAELEEAHKLSENIIFRIVLEDKSAEVRGNRFRLPLRGLLDKLKSIGIKELVFSRRTFSIPIKPEQVDSLLQLPIAEHFDVYPALTKDYWDNEKNELEGRGIKGVIIEAEELL